MIDGGQTRSWISDWQLGRSTDFLSKLFDLFCAADLSNQAKLAIAYPAEYVAWKWWQSGAFEAERGK